MNPRQLLTFSLLLISSFSFSQTDFLVSENGDTTYCTISKLETSSAGTITKIVYESNNKETIINGSEECIKIKVIQLNYLIKDKAGRLTLQYMPVDPTNAKSRSKHMTMWTTREIKVFMLQSNNVKTNKKGEKSLSSVILGKNYYSAQLGYDAKVILLSNKNIKEKMIPYMNKCDKFKNGYEGKFGALKMIGAATYYNDHCDK